MEVDATPLGKPIKGPSAFSGDLGRFVALTVHLAAMEFKLRFFGSALGYLWQLVRPLLLFGVLYVVFTEFVRLNEGVRYFPAVLLTSIVLFTFFSDATAGAVTAVVDRENLVRKIQFPRLVVPFAVVATACLNLLANLLAVIVFILATGVDPRPEWLLAIPLVAVLVVFATGLAMLLSALYPRFRDVQPIWEVLSQVLFYGSPILYVIEVVPNETFRHLIMLSPIASILEQVRHTVIDPTAPTAAEAIGGSELLLIPAAIVLAVLALGFWVFARQAPRLAEEL
ncbi:MAG: type transport system permease protein [Thermoleophilaceae bacterium]|jgi:ABC-2 type transport system permease protein|nr:type transport system permease protein [Thermoleophilaceae bacterium]